MVVLVPAPEFRNRADYHGRATTDAQGHFQLSGLPPGTYSVLAFDDVAGDEFYNPEFSIDICCGVEIRRVTSDSTANPRIITVQR
jgi:hypothetical protein